MISKSVLLPLTKAVLKFREFLLYKLNILTVRTYGIGLYLIDNLQLLLILNFIFSVVISRIYTDSQYIRITLIVLLFEVISFTYILVCEGKLSNKSEKQEVKASKDFLEVVDGERSLNSTDLLSIFSTLFRSSSEIGFIFIILSLGLISGWLRVSYDRYLFKNSGEVWENYLGKEIELWSYVVEEPKSESDQVKLVYKIDSYEKQENLNVSRTGSVKLSSIKVLAKSPRYPEVSYGDICLIKGKLKKGENFSDFNYVGYLESRGISFIFDGNRIRCYSIEEYNELRSINLASTEGQSSVNDYGQVAQLNFFYSIRLQLYNIKQLIIGKVEKFLHEPYASLMVGILIGDDRSFYTQFEESLRVTGTTHIIAASGYNINLIISGIETSLKRFLKPSVRSIIIFVSIWLFAIISGLSASIVRAAIMGSLLIFASVSGRLKSIHLIIPYCAGIFIFINPKVVENLSFLLSIMSTASLVYLSPIFIKSFEKIKRAIGCRLSCNNGRVSELCNQAIEDLFVPTLSCTVGTSPILLLMFGELSLLGLLSNLLILPVIEYTLLLSLIGLFFSLFSTTLALIIFIPISEILQYFQLVVIFLGKYQSAVLTVEIINSPLSFTISIVLMFLFIIVQYPIVEENYYFSKFHK